jgi:hypothetical protein
MNTGTKSLSGVRPTRRQRLLPWMLCGCLCCAPATRARSSESDTPPAPVTVQLEYRESESDLIHLGLSIDPQSEAFAKEPELSGRRVQRGVLSVGPGNPLPFLWDLGNGQLHLDLNRNQDLSDDPEGRFSCADSPRSDHFQRFEDVRFELPIHGVAQRLRFNLSLYDFGQTGGSIALRSYWSGKAVLQDREWELGVVPLVQGQRRAADGEIMLLRSWAALGKGFSVGDGSLDTFDCEPALFFLGQTYEVKRTVSTEPPLRFEISLIPRETALGEVRFTGQHVRRALLAGGPSTVVLDEPSGTVKAPQGTYFIPAVHLRKDDAEARMNEPGNGSGANLPSVVVQADTPALVTAGGPLTNSVMIQRRGQSLVLHYRLLGAGGETYRPRSRDGEPPRFAIYRGDRLLESGHFEFG